MIFMESKTNLKGKHLNNDIPEKDNLSKKRTWTGKFEN